MESKCCVMYVDPFTALSRMEKKKACSRDELRMSLGSRNLSQTEGGMRKGGHGKLDDLYLPDWRALKGEKKPRELDKLHLEINSTYLAANRCNDV